MTRRDLLLGRLLRLTEPAPDRSIRYDRAERPERLSAEAPTEESPPPWKRT